MNLITLACFIIIFGAILSLLCHKAIWATRLIGPLSIVLGSIIGLAPIFNAFITGTSCTMDLPWQIPFGALRLTLDPLAAVFAMSILIISPLAAVYGAGYLKKYEGKKNIGLQWFFFNILTVSMLIVVLAANAILFILAWEVMSLSSFFLVMFESEHKDVRHAGWIYLVATHIGTAFLLVLFLLLGRLAGSFNFDMINLSNVSTTVIATVFFLAIVGFGAKAGFIPMHVWLPEAHPAAPSHVSAVMSGVMIKTGIYALVRILTFISHPAPWCGWILILIGATSGILGILLALSQHDLKKLLAYSSVENIGIITLGIGTGMLGIAGGNKIVAILGFSGALLHVINHSIFKSLLFLGAGSVLHSTGTHELDQLGGLLKKMPITALTFLVGSIAICGLPPFNGFVSEFLIYVGALTGVTDASNISTAYNSTGLIVIVSLALIGGLALACFTKAFGIIFLGESRNSLVNKPHEADMFMQIPMIILATLCIVIGVSGPFVIKLISPAVMNIISLEQFTSATIPTQTLPTHILTSITTGAIIMITIFTLLAFARTKLLASRIIHRTVTWDCGYAKPNSRMQYTSSSFASPIIKIFSSYLGTRQNFKAPQGLFPKDASFTTETKDVYKEHIYKPFFATVNSGLSRFRWLQHGRLNLYILYIVATLLILLTWRLR